MLLIMAGLTVIPYVPKVANSKNSAKPLSKNVPKQFSTSNSSQRIEQNAVSIRVSTVDRSLPLQKVGRDDRAMAEGMYTSHFIILDFNTSSIFDRNHQQ
jgi:hypothetical protein